MAKMSIMQSKGIDKGRKCVDLVGHVLVDRQMDFHVGSDLKSFFCGGFFITYKVLVRQVDEKIGINKFSYLKNSGERLD